MSKCSTYLLRTFLFLGVGLAAQTILYNMWSSRSWPDTIVTGSLMTAVTGPSYGHVDLKWYAPNVTAINNLSTVVNGSGVYGFVFNSSLTPASKPYDTYNWCNMPRVRVQEYVRPSDEYHLKYVEVIHRHHKRTPYASNTFPHETYPWSCDDEALFYHGAPEPSYDAAAISWQVYTSPSNPLAPAGFNGTCQFPQISAGGLHDSRQHGKDLFDVYHHLHGFLPDRLDRSKVSFRVTNNQITSQVLSQVIIGMYPALNHEMTKVLIQPASIDSLEPTYTCPAATALYSSYGVGSNNTNWTAHLNASTDLLARLDAISGVNVSDGDWHDSFDHYFDNLSARLCHQKPLPCNATHPSLCITQEDADTVFRLGEYEYSFIYRDAPQSLAANTRSFGIWLAELAANLRNTVAGHDEVIYRHNVAHDGSISRLLSILQVDVMVWPGMGSEVVFELYDRDDEAYLRVLWSGQVLTSSNPSLGRMDLIPLDVFLAYVDGLVGVDAAKIPEMCSQI